MGLVASVMRRGMLVVATVTLLAGGCDLLTAPTVSGGPGCRKLVRQDTADYANFVKLNGITYTADGPMVGRTLGDGDLGPVHDRVRCSLRDKMDPTRGEPQDGDAAYLDAGSPLYQVRGYRPSFRLAARQDGGLVIFEADTNPRARAGRDLLDLEGKVAGSASTAAPTARPSSGRSPTPSRWPPWSGCCLRDRLTSASSLPASSPCGCWPFTCWMAPPRSAPTVPPTGASSRASWSPGGSASWSMPLPPDRRADGQVGTRIVASREGDWASATWV